MKRIILLALSVFVAAAVSSCSNRLNNDQAAAYVGQSLQAQNDATMGMKCLELMQTSSFNSTGWKTEGLSTGIVTNADGTLTIWLSDNNGGIRFTGSTNFNYDNNWISSTAKIEAWNITNNYTNYLSVGVSINESFLLSGTQIKVSNNTTLTLAAAARDEFWAFNSLTIVATNSNTYGSFSGSYGVSKSSPFTFKVSGSTFTINGTVTFSIQSPQLNNDTVTVTINYNNISANAIAALMGETYYPTGTVTGTVSVGTDTINYTIIYDGTAIARLTIGTDIYRVNLSSGTVTKVTA